MSGMVLSERIRQARLRAGLTQTQLARALETSERNVQRWESSAGNEPRIAQVKRLAEATGVTIESLLDELDDAEPAEPMTSPLSRDEHALFTDLLARIVAPLLRESGSMAPVFCVWAAVFVLLATGWNAG